ncbi:MAG: 4-hydroxy-3-methylbut-2-enyl diphosphate reductase [Actinomycetota bacterium]|nr:4-hydroxy-3-methylbut-2-enyl diphosphate reductase [Actinomycetota bacterium]
MSLDVRIARFSGFCPGVKRALKLADRTLSEEAGGRKYTVGPIIHNPMVVQGLADRGLHVLPEDPGQWQGIDLSDSTVILRSHGLGPLSIEELEVRGARIIDATCPIVKKARRAAISLVNEGYLLFIIGSPIHPEVSAIVEHLEGRAVVVSNAQEVMGWLKSHERTPRRVGVTAQTTISLQSLQAVVDLLPQYVSELKVINTLCKTTLKRQKEALKLSCKSDLMLVVGGKNSSNTNHLRLICEGQGTASYHVEKAAEIDPAWFDGVRRVGVVGGASTPEDVIDDVIESVRLLSDE